MQSGRTVAGSTGGSNGVDNSNSSLRAWQRSSSTSKKTGSKVLVTPEPIPLPYDFQPVSGLERVEATQKFMAGILATTSSRGNRTTEQLPQPRPHPQHKQQQQHEHYDDGSGGLGGGGGGGGGGAAAADIHVGGGNVARPAKYIPGLIQNVFVEADACAAGATHDDRVAADMRSFGCIIADMYLGDAHRTWCVRVGSSSDPRVQEDSAALLFAQHASKLPACVRAGVEVLLKPTQGVTRPTTQTFLHAKNPDQLLAFPPYFNDLYSMLSEFHATPNARRADVVQRSLKLLLSITEEGFAIVLPLIVRLFEHPASWRKALDLFDTVASRLTPDVMHAVFIGPMTELHKITAKSDTATLVKLFGELLLGRIIDRFGPAIYVEEFLPFLIDGLVHPTAAVALAAVAGLQFVVKKLGAVITARFVVRPILRHLSKGASQPSLEVLAAFSAEFGEAFIFELYSPFLQTQVEAHSMKMVPKSEAVLSNCISLLRGTLGQLASQSLLGYFNHLSASVLQPLLQTLVSVQSEFPNGTRPALTRAMAELLMCVSQALGRENSQDVLLPVIQVFFSAFDWIDPESERSSRPSNDGEDHDDASDVDGSGTHGSRVLGGIGGALGASTFDSTDQGGGAAASEVGDSNSASPLSSADGTDDGESREKKLIAAAKSSTDTRSEAFDAQMAAFGYSSFCQLIGQETMRRSLYNIALIEELMYDESVVLAREPPPRFGGGFTPPEVEASLPHPIPITDSDDFEYQVVGGMVGTAGPAATPSSQSRRTSSGISAASSAGDGGIGNDIGVSGMNGGGGSDGAGVGGVGGAGSSAAFGGMGMGIGQANHILNVQSGWRTHWDRQVQAKTKYPPFQFQQLQLQTFTGHSGGIKSVAVMDNESMFFSGSKDKTVKLWSAQHRYFSEDGRGQSCRRTYLGHRKAVHDVIYSPKSGHVISSDGSVHVWDPENGYCLRQFELGRNFAVAVTYILSSHVVVAATPESTLRFLDVRASSMAQEWQPSTGAHGTLRCVAVDPCNNWIAVGFSSGIVSLLDSRTGLYQAGCKAHDGDVLKIKVISSERFLTTSTDQSSALWQWRKTELCPMLIGRYKGHSDPVHCMAIYEDDLYTIAVNNRLACYNSFEPSEHEPDASTVRSTNPVKMKSFKGTISSFNILPLNQTVLLGSDTGTLSLWG